MTAAAFAGIVLAGGTRAILAAVLSPPVILLFAAFAAVVLFVSRRLRQYGRTMPLLALPPAEPCPCCTGLDSDDCTCREDCGVTQCQAAGPDEHEGTQPMEELDVPDFIREAREQDRAEAADDYLGGLLAEWERDWRKQRGGNGA